MKGHYTIFNGYVLEDYSGGHINLSPRTICNIDMIVEEYSFGKIRVHGKTYTNDVIITPEKVVCEKWWRKEGHKVFLEDIKQFLLEYSPRIVVFGTGYHGLVKVQEEVYSFLEEKGIETYALPTRDAVRLFNEIATREKSILGAFHLTC